MIRCRGNNRNSRPRRLMPADRPPRQRAAGFGLWALWLMLLCLAPAWASAATLDPALDSLPLHDQVQYLADTDNLTPGDVQALPESRWTQAPDDISFGYDARIHWFRIKLNLPAVEEAPSWLLEIAYPMLDYVDVYLANQQSGLTQIASTGDLRPFNARPVEHRDFIIPLNLNPGESYTLYLRVQTSGSLQLPLTLWQEKPFQAYSHTDLALESAFYGILLVMAIFNLFLFLSLKERAYLYYVLLVTSTLTVMMGLNGFAYQYLYPHSPAWNEYVILLAVPLCQLMLSLFARSYLELGARHPRWNRIFNVLIGALSLATVAAVFLPYAISTRISIALILPFAVINLLASFHLWQQGEKSARIFSVAWASLLALLLVTVLNKVGLAPTTILSDYGILIGTTIQALLFSFALTDRFNRQRMESMRERQAALEAMHHQRKAETALLHASSHNELTGMPNRSLFERQAGTVLTTGSEKVTALFLLHLQQFDDVNKTLGHHHADELLAQFASRINTSVGASLLAVPLEQTRGQDWYVAHIEGVSFAFILRGENETLLLEEANRLTQEFSKPLTFLDLSLELMFATGCSLAKLADYDAQTLLRHAFIALDEARISSNRVSLYRPEMNPYNARRLTLMSDLSEAIQNNRLNLHFQPQIHLKTARVAGFEALIRWNHPEHGFVPPDEFIPMAERTGLIKPLTRWVIQESLGFCKALDERDCDATVSVNISAANLREPEFCEDVCKLLEQHQVQAQRLVLEVTETAAMLDPTISLSMLRALQTAHVRLSIDDFGTGHSSLSYIRKLPVNEIKIDRSFVMEMATNQGDATIVRTTVNMCHDLGYVVVAEGVENASTEKMLTELGCDFIQGYHIARPMDQESILDWLAETDWLPSSKNVPAQR
ncbi:EAL domain-containing protein [Marinobacter sp. SS5-14b]|uniref:EAL domain-containing protein n=1 Tax=Marinobacter sp. SS5-14b TaxID=3050456 RepID=UPI0026E00E7D|nr:EAL domain-containing protein [Marinobacter sp. SS5-14b]